MAFVIFHIGWERKVRKVYKQVQQTILATWVNHFYKVRMNAKQSRFQAPPYGLETLQIVSELTLKVLSAQAVRPDVHWGQLYVECEKRTAHQLSGRSTMRTSPFQWEVIVISYIGWEKKEGFINDNRLFQQLGLTIFAKR